jgi:hypothetical protein
MKKKLSLPPLMSDIIISCYLLITLFYRFQLENSTSLSTLHSLFLGLSFVVILWALIKLKILNPNWFGMFNNSKKNTIH